MHWWWAAWLLSWLTGLVASRMYEDALTISEYQNAAVAYVIADAIDVAAALLAWFFVNGVTHRLRAVSSTELS